MSALSSRVLNYFSLFFDLWTNEDAKFCVWYFGAAMRLMSSWENIQTLEQTGQTFTGKCAAACC